ncbi:MAG: hypothetical protein AAGB01_01895 [Cyanobacteria bacterium P01_F01_bin.42]
MDNSVNLPAVAQMPILEAVQIALLFGLVLGIALALFELINAAVKRKLNMTQFNSFFGNFFIEFATLIFIFAASYLAMSSLFPPSSIRILLIDQASESLGFFPFLMIATAAMLTIPVLSGLIPKRILNQ